MMEIDKDALEQVLAALGEQLLGMEARAHLIVVGGGGLLALGVVGRSTRDVDVVALERDGVLVAGEPLPEVVLGAAVLVARDFGLEQGWLNAGPASLMDTAGGLPDGFASRMVSREYGPALQVSFASRIDQIFLKVYAAADRDAPRDLADLRQLQPTPPELQEAARWARTHNMPGPFDDDVARVLGKLGVEDVGRDA